MRGGWRASVSDCSKELLRYTNRIKGLLAGLGIYDFEPPGADLMQKRAETAAETAPE